MTDNNKDQNVGLVSEGKKYKYPENDPNYRGNQLDQNLRDGMIQSRGCTDLIFLILFIAMWVGFVINSMVGFKNGNYKTVLSPYDSSHNQCGLTKDFEKYKYIYFPQPKNTSVTVCLKKCPTSKDVNSTKELECKYNKVVVNCSKSNDFEIYSTNTIVSVCVPSSSEILKLIGDQIFIDDLTKHMNDLKTSWPLFFACAGFTFIIGFFLMWLMQYCVKIFIWIQIILIQVLLVLSALFCYQKAGKLKISDPKSDSHKIFLGVSILLMISSAIYLILICCIFKKIKLCAEIMEQAADFITDVGRITLIPILTFLLTICFFSFWVMSTLYIHTQGEPTKNGNSPFVSIKWHKNVRYQLGYNVFALIWNIEFIIAMGFFIVASSAGCWYFSEGEGVNNKQVDKPIRKSFYNLFRYHIGSIALGSLVLAIVWVIRAILNYIHQQFKEKIDDSDALQGCLKCCCSCMECCLDCFERFIRFININAYIIIAVTGKSFCSSAHEAFYMVVKNPIRFAALQWIGTFFIFFGQIFIMGLSTLACYLIINNAEYYESRIFSPVAPIIMFLIISYIISSIFMGVHGVSADTILLCFCLDEEVHRYSSQNPKYSSQKLNQFISNNKI